ncbi:MAG: His/Gly/Thr/Pro-type tRNA ligase C-terminal domain-containing protein [Candidatus Taylorbacteria bacterium]|nr:His/Gly/Thr/Pro-type tRNA ligase C-terminal domain-containing protein [Candidatus Taylorbacteria bacterium]
MRKENPKGAKKNVNQSKLDKSGEIALYYGFNTKSTPEITKSDVLLAKTLMEGDFVDPDLENSDMRLPLHVEEKVAILRSYLEEKLDEGPQPILLYFRGNFKGHLNKKADKFNRFCDLDIIGSNKSIAEATLIQTATVMLKEAGYENLQVEINSIGDKDSIALFARDLTAYYRKNLSELDPACRQTFKVDPFELLSCHKEACKEINIHAPKSTVYLSDKSRTHFMEVLEYLQSLGISYIINERLIGNRKYCSETIYEIKGSEKGEIKMKTLAVGVRYDGLAKKIGHKREIPGVGVSILLKNDPKNELQKIVKKIKKPAVCFIQLGFEAKLLSLKIIEILRNANIPVYHALCRDKLSSQIATAEKLNIPLTILVGKKEVVEGTVIVRKMSNHAQEIIKLDDLSVYMKKAVKGLDEK